MNRFNDLYKSLKEFVEPLYTKEREGTQMRVRGCAAVGQLLH